MKIATWNVNSIRSRLGHVCQWLDASPVDILCLQETKVIDPDFPRAALEALGYEFAGGFSGLKFLRTTHGSIRFKSPKIGTLLILISTFLTKRSKRFAFEILCVAKNTC